MLRLGSFAALALTATVVATFTVLAQADSHVRIVRLSSVEGQVQMDRAAGEGLERAILNTPIVEGTRLVTGSDGLAEVEFENQSALRLTDDSEVKFTRLFMNDTGDKVNQISVVTGIVYLDTASKGNDTYRVTIGETAVLAHRDSLMRLSVTPEQIQVAVLKGDIQVEGRQNVTLHKKETLTVDLKAGSQFSVVNNVEPERFDAWNKEREDYSRTYAANEGYGGPSRAYGLQDLNYYGDFFYATGYGYVWQPFGFAGSMMSWDPYSNGAWMSYPGMGYAWASAYPWGWLPFHYGSWAFINGAGWAWLPGGGYNGLWYANGFQTVPRIVRAPSGWTAALPPAVPASTSAARPTVLVGKRGAVPLAIPGGLIPPNFAGLVPGRAATSGIAASGFAKPNPSGRAFNPPRNTLSAAPHGANGHVFASPSTRSVFSGAYEGGLMEGVRTEGVKGAPAGAISGSAHSGGAAAAASSGSSAHK